MELRIRQGEPDEEIEFWLEKDDGDIIVVGGAGKTIQRLARFEADDRTCYITPNVWFKKKKF